MICAPKWIVPIDIKYILKSIPIVVRVPEHVLCAALVKNLRETLSIPDVRLEIMPHCKHLPLLKHMPQRIAGCWLLHGI